MKKKFTLAATLILSAVAAMLVVTVTLASASYSQPVDTDDCYAKEEIDFVCRKGYMDRYLCDDGSIVFLPDRAVSRQEFAKIIVRFLDASESDDVTPLADASEISDDYLPYVMTACRLGVMGLSAYDGELYFCPTEYVTRDEAAYMLGHLIDASVSTYKTENFTDYSEAEPIYAQNASVLVALDLMIGYPDGTFRPKNNITRQELALVLYRIKQSGERLSY